MTRSGIARQRWIEPIDSFVREYGNDTPRWAMICTYECNLDVLQKRVLPSLNRRGRMFRTLVLADAGALESQLKGSSASRTRTQVNIHPVRIRGPGLFHPKFVFLRAGRRARVCFGSANVAEGGLGGNLELWTHADDPEIVGAFIHFLDRIRGYPKLLLDPACKRQITRAITGLQARASTRVWTSLDESFEVRIRAMHAAKASAVTVVSPGFATVKGAARARLVFPSPRLMLFTDADAPATVPKTSIRCYSPQHPADYGPGEQADYPRTLHAKLYLLERKTGSAEAWVGSANFTAQALTKSLTNGGNVECMVNAFIAREEFAALRAELERLFLPPGRRDVAASRVPLLPAPRSTILSCEMQISSAGLRLLVHTVPGTKKVTLERYQTRGTIKVRNSIGILRGKPLQAMFPELGADSPHVPHVFVIHQVIGKERIPVVVNFPYVSDVEGRPSQASLDELIDELRGHVPRPKAIHDIDTLADPETEDDAEAEIDPEMADSERRLDEVKHQGMLDQLAVKVALARRLIMKRTEPGVLRQALLVLARRSCAAACPPALRPTLEDWLSK